MLQTLTFTTAFTAMYVYLSACSIIGLAIIAITLRVNAWRDAIKAKEVCDFQEAPDVQKDVVVIVASSSS